MKQEKNSGIEWIGNIPFDWDLTRLKFCLNEINVKNNPIQTTQVLSLMKDVGVLPYEEKGDIGNKSKENVSEYHLAYPNTIVLNCMNILIGSVGISNYFGCVSPAYYVFKETDKCDLRFINYIFNTREFQKELRKYAKGILEIRLRVSADDIFKQKVPLPSRDEQTKIANFLDQKCSEIDALSADIQSQIDILEEYKKSIITEAVTKGLNPDAEMKDSGIEWIGETPKEWDIIRINDKYTFDTGFTPDTKHSEYYTDEYGFEWATIADVKNGRVASPTKSTISREYVKNHHKKQMPAGCLLYSFKLSVGETAITDRPLFTNEAIACFYPSKDVNINFFKYSSFLIEHNANTNIYGAKILNQQLINNAYVVFPPLEVQKSIANFLDQKCSEIDIVVADKKAQLETLAEYKKSLIYEYVTGKKEVV